jgi:hypothetical protein
MAVFLSVALGLYGPNQRQLVCLDEGVAKH